MRHFALIAWLASLFAIPAWAQTSSTSTAATSAAPQSARQALIEMFLGKGADDFAKHLPEDARRAMIHPGETPETSTILRVATMGRQLTEQGQKVETFDVGPNILISEDPDSHQKIEVAVEHDSLMGETDEIELSIHVYKDGLLTVLPIVPRLIFSMQQEKEIWRVTELTIAGHIPLTDPDYLKELRREEDEAHESAAQWRMTAIVAAETAYVGQHPDQGYVCSLSTLFPRVVAPQDAASSPESPQENPQSALFDPGQGNEESNGYRFAMTGCDGNPATKYRLTAVPTDSEAATKTFCADESGSVKSVASGTAASCFSHGEAINSGAPSVPVINQD